MNPAERFEYVVLRLIRRFLFTERLANRISRWLPYYRSSVNETQPELIVSAYAGFLARAGLAIGGRDVLEVGAGRTNAVAYGLAAAGALEAWALEPFVAYDRAADDALLLRQHGENAQLMKAKVRRASHFAEIGDGTMDFVLSNSVLEHVIAPDEFLSQCRRILRSDGVMLHLVDYRDHFFKYPYAFLTFDDSTWTRWLDPGDLPRWRLHDHVAAMHRAGFRVDVIEQQDLPDQFARVRDALAPRFAAAGPDVAVTFAALLARAAS